MITMMNSASRFLGLLTDSSEESRWMLKDIGLGMEPPVITSTGRGKRTILVGKVGADPPMAG